MSKGTCGRRELVLSRARWSAILAALALLPGFAGQVPRETAPAVSSPQSYSVHRDKKRGVLVLETPFYAIEHDLAAGGAISKIQIKAGQTSNLLYAPAAAFVRNEQNAIFTDRNDGRPRFKHSRAGTLEIVETSARLLDRAGKRSEIEVNTRYEYHWGYIKIRREFERAAPEFNVREICPAQLAVAPSLTDYGYREGTTEKEGAPAFAFGSCVWGKLSGTGGSKPPLKTAFIPRYFMFAQAGVEGLEWFAGSELQPWEAPLNAGRGHGQCLLETNKLNSGWLWTVSPFYSDFAAKPLPRRCAFDFYIAVPIKAAQALNPWLHTSFNRNAGQWVSPEQIRNWAAQGFQTVHCHNDGDYTGDGLFWRDGSYPPYPDMDRYDQVIAGCHAAGLRVGTYFSNKELHPSTAEFQQHGQEWGRKNASGKLIHNFFRGTNEFGAQMCLRSGWLKFLEFSIDRVLKHHALDGVYYDWNVALFCCNGLHEGKPADTPGDGHWDIDELLQLMEWTRQRAGPKGLVIVHNTTTPMFATENFADYVVANEWGYGKWSEPGPELKDLPLEWSLVGARPRGVISYGQIDSTGERRLHRLFALEALLSGVTPWPASPETVELYPALHLLGNLATYRFADWRNQAVSLQGKRCASAVYSRPGEAWLLLGNLTAQAQRVQCRVNPDKLPCPLKSIHSASVIRSAGKSQEAPRPLVPSDVVRTATEVEIAPDSMVLLHLEGESSERSAGRPDTKR